MPDDGDDTPIGNLGLRGWSAVAANISAVALISYLLWRVITVDLPRQTQIFREDLATERKAFRDELQVIRNDHKDEMREVNAGFKSLERNVVEAIIEIRRYRGTVNKAMNMPAELPPAVPSKVGDKP